MNLRKVFEVYATATALVLGLSAGAMLAEAVVLVNVWRAISPDEFLAWYHRHHHELVQFYSPLQIAATVTAIIAAIWFRLAYGRVSRSWLAAAGAAVGVLVLFFVYFKSANAAFLSADVDPAQIPAMLTTWGAWQWFRTAVGITAAACAIVAARPPRLES